MTDQVAREIVQTLKQIAVELASLRAEVYRLGTVIQQKD
jgi:hypothetical protein